MDNNVTKVGVGVLVFREGRALMGRRADGYWGFPRGLLMFRENPNSAATRILYEETGLAPRLVQKISFENDFLEDTGEHLLSLFFQAIGTRGDARVRNVQKFTEWRWFDWTNLPTPIYPPTLTLIKSGYDPFQAV